MTDYERVRAILDAATSGPWDVWGGYDGGRTVATMRSPDSSVSVRADGVDFPGDKPWDNARAIVVARNLAPELLAVAEAAETVVALHHGTGRITPGTFNDLRAALDALHAKMKETL